MSVRIINICAGTSPTPEAGGNNKSFFTGMFVFPDDFRVGFLKD